MSASRPIVLLPPDIDIEITHRGPVGQYVSQRAYADSIVEAGGLPIIPSAISDDEALDQLIALADALVLPGGGFDVDPALFGETPHPKLGKLKPERTALERALLARAEARGLPILGVCGGMQLMNVMRGGTLYQDLDDQHPKNIGHEQVGAKNVPAHDVTITKGTWLATVAQSEVLAVNSTHHQAVRELGEGLIASATAADGVIEAFEDPARPFYVGVQWHPESMPDSPHRAIYRALIDAARGQLPGSGQGSG